MKNHTIQQKCFINMYYQCHVTVLHLLHVTILYTFIPTFNYQMKFNHHFKQFLCVYNHFIWQCCVEKYRVLLGAMTNVPLLWTSSLRLMGTICPANSAWGFNYLFIHKSTWKMLRRTKKTHFVFRQSEAKIFTLRSTIWYIHIFMAEYCGM